MSSKGYRWYNNGIEEKCLLECPLNWTSGRLKMSDESRKKMSENSWIKKATKEQLLERNKKISATIQNRDNSEKLEYSQKISKSRTGKGLGNTPWNKGKHIEVWNKGISMTNEQKQKLRDAYNKLSDEEKQRRKSVVSKNNKNKIPWNKGLTYSLKESTIKEMKLKEYETRKKNNSFTVSSLEEEFYKVLVDIYGEDNIIRQYKSDKYPFACDFYIKSEDKYIELHGNWTHGGRPFDESDESCIKQLNEWKEKAKTSKYYQNAIYTWTDLDVRKRKFAQENNLNYEVIYNVF